jgi:hypothetical protein
MKRNWRIIYRLRVFYPNLFLQCSDLCTDIFDSLLDLLRYPSRVFNQLLRNRIGMPDNR